MILSMTGFGHATLEDNNRHYHLEIRSVNNRYYKTTIRLPEEFAFLEAEVEKFLREHLTRGTITVNLHVREVGAAAAQELNVAAIQRYLDQLRSAAGDDRRVIIDMAQLLELPGVCESREMSDTEREQSWGTVSKALNEAMDRLIAMRREEGRALVEDLRKNCTLIRTHLDVITQRVPSVVSEYQKRLHARVQELMHESGARLAESDLIREVSVYAERSDISEEISRLSSHIEQFLESFNSTEPAGRKLDFIAQEMFREANTIGSKAGDSLIARLIIEIKGGIDRLKEQVQNVE